MANIKSIGGNPIVLGLDGLSDEVTHGYNPSLSVGRADALTGADETSQWATRESTGSGAATVRSVQGATEVQDNKLVPVQIAGIESTDAQGGELDAIEWTAQTLRAAGSVADMLYSDHKDTKIGVLDLGDLTWEKQTSGSDIYFRAYGLQVSMIAPSTAANVPANLKCAKYRTGPSTGLIAFGDKSVARNSNAGNASTLYVYDTDYTDTETFSAAMSGVYLYYEMTTPTTTPISPALPMTYRVEQDGSESIIVPDGEISAAPVLTIAEGESAGELVMDALACIATPDGPTATANHAINTYLTMQGKLYKVTSAIAVGESIVAGTNVTETTVMAELIARTA